MKKVMITGFEPFNGETINPSWEVAKYFEQSPHIYPVKLPCVFDLALTHLYKQITTIQPDIIICLGQSAGNTDISVECIAINLNDASIPDNQGNQPIDHVIIQDAPLAYASTLPCKAIVQSIKNNGIPASLSYSAGTYVCNHVMYGLLHFLQQHYPECRGGFIHIPLLLEQAVHRKNAPTMALDTLTKAITIAIDMTLTEITQT